MLNLDLIQKEYGFMGDTVFLNVSQVVVPPKRVQDAYRKFMDDYVSNFGIDIVSRAWDIVNNTRPKLQKLINAKESHEIAFVKVKIKVSENSFFVNGSHIECFINFA